MMVVTLVYSVLTEALVARAKSILRDTTRTRASTNDDEEQDDADGNDVGDGGNTGVLSAQYYLAPLLTIRLSSCHHRHSLVSRL